MIEAKRLKESEAAFTRTVVDTLKLLGFRVHHAGGDQYHRVYGHKGLPDVIAVRDKWPFLLALELKVGKNVASPDQLAFLAAFKHSTQFALVVYPADWPALLDRISQGKATVLAQ